MRRWEASCTNHIAMILMETLLILPACLLQAHDQHQINKQDSEPLHMCICDSVPVVIEGIVKTECPVAVGTGQLPLHLFVQVCLFPVLTSVLEEGGQRTSPCGQKYPPWACSINHACNFYLHLYTMCLRCPWQPHD